MSTENAARQEATDQRTLRAATEAMCVYRADEPGEFRVLSASNNTYTASLIEGTCTCPDFERRGESLPNGCKHLQRVEQEAGIREIPDEAGPRADVRVMIAARERVAARRAGVATDGGQLVESETETGAEIETGCPNDHPDCEGIDGRERPVLCWECWETHVEGAGGQERESAQESR